MTIPSHPTPPTPGRITYRITELPSVTGISRSAIYRAISAGQLVKRSSGRIAFVTADDLQAWLASFPASTAA